MMTWMEVSHDPWVLRLEVKSQFPDTLYLVDWLRNQVMVPKPPGLDELAYRVKGQWPDRRFVVEQAHKTGRFIVEG